jgi:hypothetical protein
MQVRSYPNTNRFPKTRDSQLLDRQNFALILDLEGHV